jgi:gamma-glutamylcyclotransferase (GGCT)/AIG2-like uncharacterized protein YtfP
MTPSYLFVYGTLLPARAPGEIRELISRLKPVAAGSMKGELYDLGDYPGALFNETASTYVRGQIFELPHDEDVLQTLDAYEECSPKDARKGLFVREKRPVALDNGAKFPCWVYLYNRNPGKARPIPGGSYFGASAQHQDLPSGSMLNP